MTKATLASLFQAEDAERFDHLERLRNLAALSKPWLLPPIDHDSKREALPSSFQSIIARGLQALEGQAILTLYPSSEPWFVQTQTEQIKQDPETDPDIYEENERALLARSVIAASKLEGEDTNDNRNLLGFRTAKRMSFANLFALGDSLERFNDDYTIQTFNLANYVTRRDAGGNVAYHVVREKDYISNLDPEIIAKANINTENKDNLRSPQSQIDIYTLVRWNAQKKVWTEQTEINNVVIRESEERVNRYISTPLELGPEDHYGHGIVELYYGDAHTLDALSERIIDFAAAASKLYPILDTGSEMVEEDLGRPTGTVLRGRVSGGLAQDVAFIQTGKLADFTIVREVRDSLRQDLGAAMLVGSSSVRDSERTTATEVMQVNVRELDTAIGGFFTSIADRNQRPTVQRLIHQCERDRLLQPIPVKDAVSTKILTGVQALAYMEKTQRVLQFAQILTQIGPEAVRRLNIGKMVDVLARYTRIAEPGLIKTEKQVQAETQAAMQQAAQMAATQQAIETGGAIVEQQATQGAV